MEKVKWDKVRQECQRAMAYFNRQGIEPTLKALFYHLISANVIPPSSRYYHLLSSDLKDWEKKNASKPMKNSG